MRMSLLGGITFLMLVATANGANAAEPPRYPAQITRFDLATRDELLYAYWLRPLIQTESASSWTWPKEFVSAVGKWSAAFVDGPKIVDAALNGCPIDGQRALAPLEEVVTECCKILDVERPRVIVRNEALPHAYVVAVGEQPHLVLTSGLLELFENRPEQLRFFVGRELGRIKGEQLKLRQVSFGLFVLLQSINPEVLPADAQGAAMTYAVGRFLSWSREAEISADRAGLVCCGSSEIAFEALATMLHGIKAESAWRDPNHPQFDADKIVADFQRWEKASVVATVRYLQQQPTQAPFIAERIAALKQYVASGQYRALLERPANSAVDTLVTIEGLDLIGLAPSGSGVYPYVKCYRNDQKLFTTATAKWGTTGYFKGIPTAIQGHDGEPIYFEVWNDGSLQDELLGGFVIYPKLSAVASADGAIRSERQKLSSRILWDWKDRSRRQQAGVVHLDLRVIPVR